MTLNMNYKENDPIPGHAEVGDLDHQRTVDQAVSGRLKNTREVEIKEEPQVQSRHNHTHRHSLHIVLFTKHHSGLKQSVHALWTRP